MPKKCCSHAAQHFAQKDTLISHLQKKRCAAAPIFLLLQRFRLGNHECHWNNV